MGKRLAKGLAALDCIRALHANGELDDHLQPRIMNDRSIGIATGEGVVMRAAKHMANDAGTIPIEVKVVADALVVEPTQDRFGQMYLYTTRARTKDIEEYNILESCHGTWEYHSYGRIL